MMSYVESAPKLSPPLARPFLGNALWTVCPGFRYLQNFKFCTPPPPTFFPKIFKIAKNGLKMVQTMVETHVRCIQVVFLPYDVI